MAGKERSGMDKNGYTCWCWRVVATLVAFAVRAIDPNGALRGVATTTTASLCSSGTCLSWSPAKGGLDAATALPAAPRHPPQMLIGKLASKHNCRQPLLEIQTDFYAF